MIPRNQIYMRTSELSSLTAMPANGGRIDKKLLLVDYYFPPMGGSGVRRTLGWIKYLREYGWSPLMVTVRGGDASIHDPSLGDRIPADILVHRAPSFEPVRFAKRALRNSPLPLRRLIPWIFFPDRRIGWLLPAIAAGIHILRSQPIDLICSTYSDTITAHLIAYVLKMVSGKPWVADFQDPWSEPYVSSFPTSLHRNIAQVIEQAILKKADHVIVTTSAVRDAYAQKYPSLVRGNVSVIPIGFDSDPFQTTPPASHRSSFRITHFGVFWGSRSPAPFLKGLAQAIKIDNRLAGSIEVKFLGSFDPRYLAMTEEILRDFGLRGKVFLEGFVPYTDGVRILLDSDVLLLVADETEFGKRLVPCKLFDYLAAGRPILALAPEGEAARIVRGANAGMIVNPTDVSRIADAIVHLYGQWQGGHLRPATDKKYVQRFSCQETTKQFASLLDRLISSREVPLSQGEER